MDELGSMALVESKADPEMGMYFQRLMRAKDEGATRSLQGMRQQTMYLYRDLEHQRAQIVKLTKGGIDQSAELAAVEEVRQSFLRSKSWRLTKPLRAVARLFGSE